MVYNIKDFGKGGIRVALNPEEMKRRRQEKKLQQQKKTAARKKLLIRLGIAAGILLVCGVLILVIALGNRKPEEPEQPEQLPEASAAEQEQTQTEAQKTVIHLAAAGDLNVTDNTVAAGGAMYDYTKAFLDVAYLLAHADVSVVNFEGGLYGDPYGTATASAPQSMMEALAAAGVDMVQLANSYSINDGVSGLRNTINGVRLAGMEPLGVYADSAAFNESKGFTMRNVNGIKVAFVAFTKGMDGMALPSGSEKCVNVLYTDYSSTYQKVDTAGISAVMDAVASAKPDVTVVLVHWGSEFNDTISSSQKKIVELLQSKGANAIIGTHSHYVQKMTLDPDTGKFVAYSLGDFFGDADRAGSEYSVVLDLEITKDHKSGDTKITNYSYTPIFTVTSKNQPAKVVRIHEAMTAYDNLYLERVDAETYAAMAYALERIESRVLEGD